MKLFLAIKLLRKRLMSLKYIKKTPNKKKTEIIPLKIKYFKEASYTLLGFLFKLPKIIKIENVCNSTSINNVKILFIKGVIQQIVKIIIERNRSSKSESK